MFSFLINCAIFIFGLIIGSFLNCLVYRLEKEESLMGRSYCPQCKHHLVWYDLIPLFSFLFLKGACRYCSKKISWQYPIVELSTGLLFLLVFHYQLPTFNTSIFYFLDSIFWLYITSVFIVIFVYDLKHYLIPDAVLFPAIVITLLYRLIFNFSSLLNFVMAAGIAFLFFYFLYFISRETWMGFGDCKLAILLGLLLGFPFILLGVFLSFLSGALIGTALMIVKRKNIKSQLPFAPFLIAGTFTMLLFGQHIFHWYVNLFYF